MPAFNFPKVRQFDPVRNSAALHNATVDGLRWLERNRPAEPKALTIVHSDVRNGNLIISEQGLAAILDWEGSRIGDPAEELHPWIVGEPSGIVAIDALRAVDAWLPTSGENARIDKEQILFWGWSEGGYTALQADQYVGSYAPDYAPIGIVTAVPPLDIVGQVAAGMSSLTPATRP